MASKVSENYFYDTVFKLIDYCGDIERHEQEGNASSGYSASYSPNNIKSLIFSPSFACVTYHLPVDGHREKYLRLNEQLYPMLSERKNFKPIINVLADHICASIEEVVIISISQSNVSLDRRELELSGLIKNYRSNTGDLQTDVSNRYSRLRDFCIINQPLDLKQISELLKRSRFIADSENIVPMNVTYLHKDDWYKENGLTAKSYSTYILDTKLGEYFKSMRSKVDEKNKSAEIDKIKSKRLGEVLKMQDTALKQFNNYVDYDKRLRFFLKNSSSIIDDYDYTEFKYPIELHSAEGLKEDNKFYTLKKTDLSDSQAISENANILKMSSYTIYCSMAHLLLSSLVKLGKQNPITLKTILNDKHLSSIAIPKSELNLNAQLKQLIGKNFTGVKYNINNLCSLFTSVFISELDNKDLVRKYSKPEAWKGGK